MQGVLHSYFAAVKAV